MAVTIIKIVIIAVIMTKIKMIIMRMRIKLGNRIKI